MWTRQELEEIFPCAEKRYLDALFARRKEVTLTNIVMARSISKEEIQYAIWNLDSNLWKKARGEDIESSDDITTDNWHKFVKAVKILDKEN